MERLGLIGVMLSDTHYTKNNTEIIEGIFEQAFQLAIQNNSKRIIHLGDVFTDRTGQGLIMLMSFLFVLNRANELGLEILMIAGNHDKTDLESTASYLDVFKHHPSLFLFDKETLLKIEGVNCCFLPYFKENGSYPNRLAKVLKKLRKNELNLCFTHIAVNGVKNNDGTEVSEGVKVKSFAKFKKVFTGHYHNRSKVGENIIYIGSPRPKDFGENNDKGFTVLYINGEYEFVKAKFQKYLKFKYDLENISRNDIFSEIELKKQLLLESKVKLVFSGTEDELSAIPSDELKTVGFFVEKINIGLLRSVEYVERTDFKRYDEEEIKEAFNEFLEQNKIEGEHKQIGLNYIQKL